MDAVLRGFIVAEAVASVSLGRDASAALAVNQAEHRWRSAAAAKASTGPSCGASNHRRTMRSCCTWRFKLKEAGAGDVDVVVLPARPSAGRARQRP